MKIVHCKKEPYDVYIGRPTVFGNPFQIGRDGTREEVILKYRAYFRNRVKTDSGFRNHVLSLRGKTLACWCKPAACHGDAIKEYLEEL